MNLISFLLIARYGFPSKQYKKQAHKIIEEGKNKQWFWALHLEETAASSLPSGDGRKLLSTAAT